MSNAKDPSPHSEDQAEWWKDWREALARNDTDALFQLVFEHMFLFECESEQGMAERCRMILDAFLTLDDQPQSRSSVMLLVFDGHWPNMPRHTKDTILREVQQRLATTRDIAVPAWWSDVVAQHLEPPEAFRVILEQSITEPFLDESRYEVVIHALCRNHLDRICARYPGARTIPSRSHLARSDLVAILSSGVDRRV